MTKTTRLMLAVLAVCGTSAAMAQSSVTLYGRVNTTVEHQKLGNSSATGMVSNSSYIGFRGTEDLGNGLKAGFILEAGFNSDNGSGNAGFSGDQFNFSRQSELNLSGNFGTVRLGNFDSAALYAISDPVSMHNHDTGTSADVLAGGYVNGGNKIAYVTPNFGGFTAEAQYQFGEKAKAKNSSGADIANSEVKNAYDLALNYGNGPLALGLGYSNYKETYQLGQSYEKTQQLGGYAAYSFGNFTLAGYYQRQQENDGASKSKRDVYRIAAKYELGASEFHANVGRASKLKENGISSGNSATQWTVAYNYNLSKRTKVYALYTSLNHTDTAGIEAPAAFSFGNNTGNDKFRAFGLGVRHLF